MQVPQDAIGNTDTTETFTPRYLRDKGATAMFGLSRTKLYTLAKEKKIKSISLQEEGTSRGTRLFCVDSIERYISSFDKKTEPAI